MYWAFAEIAWAFPFKWALANNLEIWLFINGGLGLRFQGFYKALPPPDTSNPDVHDLPGNHGEIIGNHKEIIEIHMKLMFVRCAFAFIG